ncbi:MAG: DEAD/DEAH box helicase family protein [Lachnospiraceae bacterium]|nr:DEAD/DEAH box helicase family protein [Lachnospiraceae bacterium]
MKAKHTSKNLYQILDELRRQGEILPLPSYIAPNLNPDFCLRPYQAEAIENFVTYYESRVLRKNPSQTLFHMATGSGKTLIMASLILYLYQKGYRNFLFFVNLSNIVKKTRENFLNATSSKYLFASTITMNGEVIPIKEVENFQYADDTAINLCFTTTQGLHQALWFPGENALSMEDFKDGATVLISDEAHHLNQETVAGNTAKMTQQEESSYHSWESTVRKIFESNPENVLLEFTATCDLANPYIRAAYADKIIMDYPLQRFRADRYSKEIKTLRSDIPLLERELQAIILSQYRLKVFEEHRISMKPVVLMKASRILESIQCKDDFLQMIHQLKGSDIRHIANYAQSGIMAEAFAYFYSHDISYEELALELKEAFDESHVLCANDESEAEESQILLNSLEDRSNPYRVIFEVRKLDEGWDVLNLFDIVRLYETKASAGKKPSRSTVSEAQLIGRGARYCPFTLDPTLYQAPPLPFSTTFDQGLDPGFEDALDQDFEGRFDDGFGGGFDQDFGGGDDLIRVVSAPSPQVGYGAFLEEFSGLEKYRRKFDDDIENPLRVCEELYYHCQNNSRYIEELKTALKDIGIELEHVAHCTTHRKKAFLESNTYTKGYLFTNEKRFINREEVRGLLPSLRHKIYPMQIHLGKSQEDTVFQEAASQMKRPKSQVHTITFAQVAEYNYAIVQRALCQYGQYRFDRLKKIFPHLSSTREFIQSSEYLGGIRMRITTLDEELLPETLSIACNQVLFDLTSQLMRMEEQYEGSTEFYPRPMREVFQDKTCHYTAPSGYGLGISQNDPAVPKDLRLDLSKEDWYAFDDNYGTSEEKAFVAAFKSYVPYFKERFKEVFLIRNERQFHLYSFAGGERFEPDYVLSLRGLVGEEEDSVHLLIFIEPKGKHLLHLDSWKENFLLSLEEEAIPLEQEEDVKVYLAGMHFFNTSERFVDFKEDLDRILATL